MTQTNKPLVFLRLTPVLLPIVLLASVFMITACGGKKSGALPAAVHRPAPAFTSNVRDDRNRVKSNFQGESANISILPDGSEKDTLADALGREYLESISVNIPRDGRLETFSLQGDHDGTNLTLTDGFLMTFISNSKTPYAHSVVGIFEDTQVGAPLGADASFTGKYIVRLLAFPDGTTDNPNPAPLGEIIGVNSVETIDLEVNFSARTLTGSKISSSGARLRVDGEFGDNVISGSVTFVEGVRSMSFEAPLTGIIGQDGAVGVFANSNNGVGTKYSLGGGFVVEPEPANNN